MAFYYVSMHKYIANKLYPDYPIFSLRNYKFNHIGTESRYFIVKA